ncbi:MAG: hypothetical protein A2X67_12590 [Ignavibacteria bacterium GWA2_55_11]|nr:MAG: hypothetical protein A2X67_12590 [Ignavibacteria bacterium GWA2_55_11]OGU45866.1 MAG: hypothetical protein A2X68_06825 [Ignavibacteria bacterium GWC2_56_12]OGU64667.1 MAG: hypothetical protein A3C56_06305 [Ignavibacteria bacterium RIFCSPHIGHO2_02_FULL_56_12]OGU71648.1 MAG: hypothetical protein A3H45_00700 [Ignavibacteria bacterium RIFCSPLOWO2_02_FULL_55_14]OGU72644.1 MAG: hypothetical protein A3G43_07840 [Ignavibacteria bacterium RIFCSPLOWO2_12_FULL_56_21]
MNCEASRKQIGRLADSEVTSEESAEVFAHLGGCEECRKYYMQLQLLNASFERLRQTEDPSTDKHIAKATTPRLHLLAELWSRHVSVRFPIAALFVCTLAAAMILAIQLGLQPRDRETVYVTKLREIVITANNVE